MTTPMEPVVDSDSPAEVAPRRRLRGLVVGLVAVVAIAALLWQGLGNATLYFKTAAEAVEQRDELGDRRFRLEGVVVPDTTEVRGDGVVFKVTEGGATVDVVHRGDPPELFQDSIPVVLEGRWEGQRFSSDRMLVKHTSEYREDNPDRVKDYEKP